jgi:hypothetical protein
LRFGDVEFAEFFFSRHLHLFEREPGKKVIRLRAIIRRRRRSEVSTTATAALTRISITFMNKNCMFNHSAEFLLARAMLFICFSNKNISISLNIVNPRALRVFKRSEDLWIS